MQLDKKIDTLAVCIKKYVKTNFDLIKLETLEHTSVISSSIVGIMVVVLIAGFFMLFTSLFLGFYLSSIFENNYIGFAIVAGFYLLLGLLIYFNKEKWIEIPMCNSIIKQKMNQKFNEI